jgi:hypothetical protein
MNLLTKYVHLLSQIEIDLPFSIISLLCEEFGGFYCEGETPTTTAIISGIVSHIFTDTTASFAQIQICTNITVSDALREYLLHFTLEGEKERDEPVPVNIYAENYFPFSNLFMLYPTDTYHHRLFDAAPSIQESVLAIHSGKFVCQAQILDFQRVADFISLVKTFLNPKEVVSEYTVLNKDLDLIQSIFDTQVYCRCLVPFGVSDGWLLNTRKEYKIEAKDEKYHAHVAKGPVGDDFLFPPPEN